MLHLIERGRIERDRSDSREKSAGQVLERGAQFPERRGLMHRALLGRTMLGGLLLGLIPAPLPILLPAMLPHLDAQAVPTRLRRAPDYPAVAPNQTPQTPQTQSAPQTPPPQAAAAAPVPAPASSSLPPSMLDQPAQPAKIEFAAKTLSIHADNSSLNTILRDISTQSGMQLQGLSGDERVFGSFGPGTPREVLADLLNGTPYNLVMVGDLKDGAPRQLILTPSTPGGPAPPSADESSPAGNDAANEAPAPRPPEPGQRREIVPGMNPQTVRTPQQMLQELQHLRDRQQQGGEQPQQ